MAITVVPQEDWSRALPEVGKAIAQALIQRRQMEQQQWFQAIQLYSQTGSELDERTFGQVFPYLKDRYAEYQNSISGVRRQLQQTEYRKMIEDAGKYGVVPDESTAQKFYGVPPDRYRDVKPLLDEAAAAYKANVSLTTQQAQWLKDQKSIADEQLQLMKDRFGLEVTQSDRSWYLGLHQARMQELAMDLQRQGLDIQRFSLQTQRQLAELQGRQIAFTMQRELATDAREAAKIDLEMRQEFQKRMSDFNTNMAAVLKAGGKIEDMPTMLAEQALLVHQTIAAGGGDPFALGMSMEDAKRFYGPEIAEGMYKEHQAAVARLAAEGKITPQEQESGNYPGFVTMAVRGAQYGVPTFAMHAGAGIASTIGGFLFGNQVKEAIKLPPGQVFTWGPAFGVLPSIVPAGTAQFPIPGERTLFGGGQPTTAAGAMIGGGSAAAGGAPSITQAVHAGLNRGFLTPEEEEKYRSMSQYIPSVTEIPGLLGQGGGSTSGAVQTPAPPGAGVIDYGQFLGNFMSPADALNAERFRLNTKFPLKK